VLLQRLHAKRIGDLELCQVSVRAVRADEVLTVATKERGRDPAVAHLRIVEITLHVRYGWRGHGSGMLRPLPLGCRIAMTTRARLAADIGSLHGSGDIPDGLFRRGIGSPPDGRGQSRRNDERAGRP